MTLAKYPLSQPAACQTIRIMWNNCKNNITEMHSFKALFTTEYCTAQITATNNAEAMPDEAARTMAHEMLHLQLVADGKACTNNWQSLKLYINGVYDSQEERVVQYNGAGWGFFESASNENWPSVNSLMQDGYNYITENIDTLKGEDDTNMPEAFPATFLEGWKQFQTTWAAFTQAETDARTGAADKVKAINACYTEAIQMGEVGQHIFREEEEVRKQFSFEAVGALVEPAGPASFEVTVMVNGVAKAGAEVSIEGTDKALITTAEGKALFTQMHEGPLQCLVQCDGYTQQLVTETLASGVRKRITVTLQPLFSGEFEVGSETVSAPQESISNPQ